jgi:hypothetical protein
MLFILSYSRKGTSAGQSSERHLFFEHTMATKKKANGETKASKFLATNDPSKWARKVRENAWRSHLGTRRAKLVMNCSSPLVMH